MQRERAVADRRAQEISRGQRLAFGQRIPHQGGAIFGQFDAVGRRPEPLGQLQEGLAFTGARVEDETFTRAGRPEPFQDGGDGGGGGGIEAAFDLGHETGHVKASDGRHWVERSRFRITAEGVLCDLLGVRLRLVSAKAPVETGFVRKEQRAEHGVGPAADDYQRS